MATRACTTSFLLICPSGMASCTLRRPALWASAGGAWPHPRAEAKRGDVSGVDVLPTLCDYAGIEYPEVAGDSLRPLLENPRATGRPFVVAELHPDTMDLSMQGRMLRDERYKYIGFSRGRDAEMLFDLHEDPGETRNLAHEPAAHDELVRYREMLCTWCEEHEDDFAVSHEG